MESPGESKYFFSSTYPRGTRSARRAGAPEGGAWIPRTSERPAFHGTPARPYAYNPLRERHSAAGAQCPVASRQSPVSVCSRRRQSLVASLNLQSQSPVVSLSRQSAVSFASRQSHSRVASLSRQSLAASPSRQSPVGPIASVISCRSVFSPPARGRVHAPCRRVPSHPRSTARRTGSTWRLPADGRPGPGACRMADGRSLMTAGYLPAADRRLTNSAESRLRTDRDDRVPAIETGDRCPAPDDSCPTTDD